MKEMTCTVTLWLAWYREQAEYQDVGMYGQPRRLLRLKMLHASSREDACAQMQQWLVERGLFACDLERLEPSPYGLQFQSLKVAAL